jgi:hypothetical protein
MMTWIPQVLRNAGLDVRELDGWATRGNTSINPRGVVLHHSADQSSNPAAYARFLFNGRTDLPGPLYNVYADRDGVQWVIGAGRANHAGSGGWKGLAGNSSVFGYCLGNNGLGEAYPPVQMVAAETALVAILRFLDVPADMLCGHKEWTTRKPDPAGIEMGVFRTLIRTRLVEPEPEQLTLAEQQKLRELIRSWESVGSNTSWPQFLIPDYRRRNP